MRSYIGYLIFLLVVCPILGGVVLAWKIKRLRAILAVIFSYAVGGFIGLALIYYPYLIWAFLAGDAGRIDPGLYLGFCFLFVTKAVITGIISATILWALTGKQVISIWASATVFSIGSIIGSIAIAMLSDFEALSIDVTVGDVITYLVAAGLSSRKLKGTDKENEEEAITRLKQ